MSKAKGAQLAKTAAVVGAIGYFAITKLVDTRKEAVANGEESKIPEAITKGYGPAAVLAAIGYFVAMREKNAIKGAGIQAGAFAAAAALAIANYQAEKAAAPGTPNSGGRLLQYNPQAAGRFMAAGAQGRPSQNINKRTARRIRVA
jgi:hypothetical protein